MTSIINIDSRDMSILRRILILCGCMFLAGLQQKTIFFTIGEQGRMSRKKRRF
jgi:hypothetical protein